MLRWRLLLGTLLVGALVVLCWLDYHSSRPGLWLAPLALLTTLAGGDEVLSLAAARPIRASRVAVAAGLTMIVAANWLGHYGAIGTALGPFATIAAALALALLLLLVVELARYRAPGMTTERLAVGALALLYVGLLMSFLMQLRFLGGGRWGLAALASMIAVVKLADIGAYTVGRMLGRHKLAPTISPGKTIEGLAGGFLFAIAGAGVMFHYVVPGMIGGNAAPTPIWGWALLAVLLTAAGVLGDLVESMLKRDLGRKDSSLWMPGFGGVLDLLDSLLLAAPVAWLCWICGLVGP